MQILISKEKIGVDYFGILLLKIYAKIKNTNYLKVKKDVQNLKRLIWQNVEGIIVKRKIAINN